MNGIPVQKGAAEILNYVYQAAQNRVSDAHAVLDSVFAAAKPMKGGICKCAGEAATICSRID